MPIVETGVIDVAAYYRQQLDEAILLPNDGSQPPGGIEGETFVFLFHEFDVELARRITADKPVDNFVGLLSYFNDFIAPGFVTARIERAMQPYIDTSVPVILADILDSRIMIDGAHRVVRAVKEGKTTIPCKVLNHGEALACCLTRDVLMQREMDEIRARYRAASDLAKQYRRKGVR
jgi:hypothetical protein